MTEDHPASYELGADVWLCVKEDAALVFLKGRVTEKNQRGIAALVLFKGRVTEKNQRGIVVSDGLQRQWWFTQKAIKRVSVSECVCTDIPYPARIVRDEAEMVRILEEYEADFPNRPSLLTREV